MKYIEYVHLPSIPEHLIESISDIMNKPTQADFIYFKTKPVSDDLKLWLKTIFDFDIDPKYQLVYNKIPIHVDRGDRITAFNYLLDTGGGNVSTAIYDKHKNLLQSEILDLKRWHRIDTSMPHCVHGINPNQIRVARSIGYKCSGVPRR
jgi:hypothetical protein